jgi:hypothetical protein
VGIKIRSKAHKITLIYASNDSAIIPEESDVPQYVETLDPKFLKFEPIDEEEDQFGASEFWCKLPDWEMGEPLFWQCLGDMRKMALEAFRIWAERFGNIRWRDPETKEIRTLECRKRHEPGIGKVVRPEILEMIPSSTQFCVGSGILTVSGVAAKALELLKKLEAELDVNLKVIPGEHEKNSSASES